jgi:hypothetical protein
MMTKMATTITLLLALKQSMASPSSLEVLRAVECSVISSRHPAAVTLTVGQGAPRGLS